MDNIKKLISFIDNSHSMYHAVENLEKELKEKGFTELKQRESWNISKGNKYYVKNNNSSIIAFIVGEELKFKIVGSHSDSPTFKVKPNPIISTKNHFLTLNTEVYGGPIFSSWFDRALSFAGRVIYKEDDKIKEKNLSIDKDLLIISNPAIHFNREVNKGYSYNAQKDTLPLLGLSDEKIDILDIIEKYSDIKKETILDYDLYLYDREGGKIIGLNDEFLSIQRLDNLSMAYLSTLALMDTEKSNSISVSVVFDNEEIGSRSRQGAKSPFLRDTLERILITLGENSEEIFKAYDKSFIISADQAHSIHPNYLEYSDITNYPMINKGVVIKKAANKSYTTDAVSASIFKDICNKVGVDYQEFVNRSDKIGGSTIGPITQSKLNIKSIDIGLAVLAMHSARELGGVKDHIDIYKIFREFFK